MKENFKKALDFVLAHECVFSHGHDGDYSHVIWEEVPGDAGGLTKFGIDQASHPHVNIRALDYLGAVRIYRDGEWTKCRCDELPAGFDVAVFDCAVNCGCATAAKLLQRACDVIVDGHIGDKTLGAAERAPGALSQFLILRLARYHEIVADHPSQAKFLPGWLNRLSDLNRAIKHLNPASEEAIA